MSNIVSLRGEEIISPGEAVPEVVRLAEAILEMARSGEARGLFIVVNHVDDTHSKDYAGEINNGTLGAVERLKYIILRRLERE